jgi:hypothetical protein
MKGLMLVLLLGAIALCAAHDADASSNRKMLDFGGEMTLEFCSSKLCCAVHRARNCQQLLTWSPLSLHFMRNVLPAWLSREPCTLRVSQAHSHLPMRPPL